jgi:peptidylprolyl isomerase
MTLRAFALAALAAVTLTAKPPVPAFTTTPSGLQYAEMRVGHGPEPAVGQNCSVLYRGWLYEGNRRGKLFDSAQNRKRPFSFPVGKGVVIPGWDEGVKTMKAGGKRVLIVPPALGYGAQGAGSDIPPGATLLFEVELLSIK